jgi:hypothetical protein
MQKWFILVLILAAILPCAWPQASTGTVSGTVRDQSGAIIPNTQVMIVNTATNVTSNTRTNDAGFYFFPGLIPGPYRLTVEVPGMQKYEGTLTLQAAYSAVIDPVMRPAQATTTVEVTDVTPMVTVDNALVRDTIEHARIEQLPINGRTLNALIVTLPGAEGTGGEAGHRSFGAPGQAQEWIVDGAVVTDRRWNMSLFAQVVGMGAVQEFTVDTGAVSAKHSRPSNVIISTRSGTNQLHGTAYETHRNNAIGLARARTDYYDKAPQLIRNEFGVNAGGPVFIPKIYDGRNRTFWFLNYEGRREVSATTQNFYLPTEAMRKGDFSGLVDSQQRLQVLYDPWSTNTTTWARQPFNYGGKLNVIDPSRISPTMKYLFDITPMPTTNANPVVDYNWFGLAHSFQPNWTVTGRIDHRFSDRDQFYVRGHWNQNPSVGRNTNQASPQATNNVPGWKYTLDGEKALSASWLHTFSPSFFNELLVAGRYRVGGGYTGTSTEVKEDWYGKLGMPNPFGARDWPQFTDLGLGPTTYALVAPGTDRANETYYTVDDNITRIHGRHELQFGGHWRKDQMNVHPNDSGLSRYTSATLATALYDPASTASAPVALPQTGYGIANMYLGVATYQNSLLRSWYYLRGGESALYFQDNYKVTSRLTLNLGIRWEYWRAYRDKNNMMVGFDPANKAMVLGTDLDTMYRMGASVPSVVAKYQSLGLKFESWKDAGLPQNLVNDRNKNFGPRVGFAYRALDGRKSFVIRGGYSLAYFNLDQNSFISGFNSNTPLSATFNYLPNDATQSPDGLQNYGLRSVPVYIMGVNSTSAIDLNQPRGITRGTASAYYFSPDQPDSRLHSWNLTLEKEVASSTVARIRYVGNHSSNLSQWYDYNTAANDYIWYTTTHAPTPSGEYSNVARRPYDQQVLGTVREYRSTGYANNQAFDFELERRYEKGYSYQLSYVMTNSMTTGVQGQVNDPSQYLPGAVPSDYDDLNRFLNYRRDTGIPKHRVQFNWLADLPFGKGKLLGRNAGKVLDKFIGGWQLAGIGNLRSTYFSLPTSNWNLTGEPIEIYGYKYPIQDCRSGSCIPGYLWWNGYIPANQINSPTGYMGIPADYKPAVTPLIPWGSTALPPNAPANTNVSQYWDTNNVWIPITNSPNPTRIAYNNNLHPWRNQYLPSVRQWGLDASLFKNIPIREPINLRFAADFFNVFNHPGNPNTVGGDGFLNCRASGQGPRILQLSLRLDW